MNYIIMTDRKHYCWIKDAEANDMIHMGSEHRCVMAKFEIPPKKNEKDNTSQQDALSRN